jgi:2-amino-4-hydroxy-6-hydroxymethyldihydropteridine diphosphokinase
MNSAYLVLGGNLGNRALTIHKAIAKIREKAGTVLTSSSIYETAAWGYTEQPSFYNCVIHLYTGLPAPDLLALLLDIEKELGRIREQKWHERTIDIDILYYNDEVIDQPGLVVPHPHIQERKFVLVPLVEIAPGYVHPVLKLTNAALLQSCTDLLEVTKV